MISFGIFLCSQPQCCSSPSLTPPSSWQQRAALSHPAPRLHHGDSHTHPSPSLNMGIISCSVMEHHKAQFTFIKPRTDHAVEAEAPPTLSILLFTCSFGLKTCSGGLTAVASTENPFRQRMCTHKVPVHPRKVPYRHVPEVATWVGASTHGAVGGPGCHG